jgi:ABC-type nitrate/sulfonate/bicarbonate transport system substrate-binding protein
MTGKILTAFVPLVDSAVLVAAREKGFARERGIELTLVREPSWASLRDHLNLGYVDCAHALAPLPIASALGVSQVRVDTFVPFVLGRGGNAITLSAALAVEIEKRAAAEGAGGPRGTAAALAAALRERGTPLTLAMVYPFSGHNFELRYWLASAGIDPDRHVRLVAIPPPLMVESLRAGQVDGFCVGEPWNSVAVDENIGRIVVTKAQLFPHGIEKVLAVRESLALDRERLDPLLRSLAAAAEWCDAPEHRAELATLLARPEYLSVSPALIERALSGRLELGRGGPAQERPDFLYFHRHDANLPQKAEALWIYAQMVRWGLVAAAPALERHAESIFRPELYQRALGLDAIPSGAVDTAFDGVEFAADDVAGYLARFAVRATRPDAGARLQP